MPSVLWFAPVAQYSSQAGGRLQEPILQRGKHPPGKALPLYILTSVYRTTGSSRRLSVNSSTITFTKMLRFVALPFPA